MAKQVVPILFTAGLHTNTTSIFFILFFRLKISYTYLAASHFKTFGLLHIFKCLFSFPAGTASYDESLPKLNRVWENYFVPLAGLSPVYTFKFSLCVPIGSCWLLISLWSALTPRSLPICYLYSWFLLFTAGGTTLIHAQHYLTFWSCFSNSPSPSCTPGFWRAHSTAWNGCRFNKHALHSISQVITEILSRFTCDLPHSKINRAQAMLNPWLLVQPN